jgi:hypothetical protein
MDIYRYIAENEKIQLTFHFTYEVRFDELVQRIEHAHGGAIHVYDVFPHPNTETMRLKEPMSIITKSGKEMFLPSNFEINLFDKIFVLFGNIEETTAEAQNVS